MKISFEMRGFLFLVLWACVAASVTLHPSDPVSPTATRYPVQATWMRDHYTKEEWVQSLSRFAKQGGQSVWQRGPLFYPRAAADIKLDFDFAWCTSPYAGSKRGVGCVDYITASLRAKNITIANYVTYSYQENYSDAILACPQLDLKIESSRVYWLLVLPHTARDDPCSLQSGDTADVLLLHFDGVDSKELMLNALDAAGMKGYLGMPNYPTPVDAQWDADPQLMPAYNEFVRRLFTDYMVRYGHLESFAGVYQPMEMCMCSDPLPNLMGAYVQTNALVRKYLPGKQWTLSPYVDVNRRQINSTVDAHAAAFKEIARTGVDVIAVQEGRGVAKAAYFFANQNDTLIATVDPLLLKIVQYLDPDVPATATFGDIFAASTRDLFAAFAQAQEELRMQEGVSVALWANLEAFEYTRDAPCLPVDPVGNAMAELLDRTAKHRIDWGLSMQGAFRRKCAWRLIRPGYLSSR